MKQNAHENLSKNISLLVVVVYCTNEYSKKIKEGKRIHRKLKKRQTLIKNNRLYVSKTIFCNYYNGCALPLTHTVRNYQVDYVLLQNRPVNAFSSK